MTINFFFQIVILIISVMAHEVAHGAAAYAFGDPTAKKMGRLTLNPLKHLDIFGSILLPLLLYLTNAGFLFGWAKPVPYNPYNLKNRRLGELCVSVAGVATNFLIAFIFALFLHLASVSHFSLPVIGLLAYIVLLNLTLGVFNLVPVPPLDGSKILFNLLPARFEKYLNFLERYGFYLAIIFIIFFGFIIGDIVNWLFSLLVKF